MEGRWSGGFSDLSRLPGTSTAAANAATPDETRKRATGDALLSRIAVHQRYAPKITTS